MTLDIVGRSPQALLLAVEPDQIDGAGQVAATQGDAGITSTPTVFIDGEEFELGQDLDAAIDNALTAVFLHSGQVCSAGARLIVEESIHDRVVDEIVRRAEPQPEAGVTYAAKIGKAEAAIRQAGAEWRLLSTLRARGYDLVVHLTEHPRGAWLKWLCAARRGVAPRTSIRSVVRPPRE